MSHNKYLAIMLATSAIVAAPAIAGGPAGRTGNCLCQAVNALTSNGAPAVGRSARGAAGKAAIVRSGPRGQAMSNRSINGNVSGSVGTAFDFTTSRSDSRQGKQTRASFGLAGTVSSAGNATANVARANRGIGLAGSSSTHGSVNKQIGLNVNGANARSLAGKVSGTGGQVASVSALNGTGPTNRSLVNVSVLNRSGGTAGKVANVSVFNKTGTEGRSMANVAVLNGSGGTAGKVANVSVLNRSGSTGSSLVNASALNGNAGGTGRVANISALNGPHGNGNGGLNLPNGVRIINGVPCGPDGKPLTGAAAQTVMAMIASSGRNGSAGSVGASGARGRKVPGDPSRGNPPRSASGGGGRSSANGGGPQTGITAPPPTTNAPPRKASASSTYPFEDRINRDKN